LLSIKRLMRLRDHLEHAAYCLDVSGKACGYVPDHVEGIICKVFRSASSRHRMHHAKSFTDEKGN